MAKQVIRYGNNSAVVEDSLDDPADVVVIMDPGEDHQLSPIEALRLSVAIANVALAALARRWNGKTPHRVAEAFENFRNHVAWAEEFFG